MRREIIQRYLGVLYAEGVFADVQSPLEIVKRAGVAFAEDAAAVLATAGAKRFGDKLACLAADIRARGFADVFGALWAQAQAAHARGTKVNAQRGKK